MTVAASLLVLICLGLSGQASAAKSTKRVNASPALKALVKHTKGLPTAAASPKAKAKLLRAARGAASVARTRPCKAVKTLATYRKVLGTAQIRGSVKGKKAKARLRIRLAALGPASLKASRKLLADKRTKRCGGGVIPSRLKSAKTTVLASDENGMRLRVKLPALAFASQTGGGKSWTQLVLPNSDAPGADGKPGIPVVSSLFGVPDGAKVEVSTSGAESYVIEGVDVFPNQPEPVDAVNLGSNPPKPNFLKPPFATKPFEIDKAAYKHDGLVPPAPADGQVLGQARDVTIGGLQIPAAQYDAADHTLKVLNSVDVKVTFEGGSKTFSDELNSPWERSQRGLVASLLNRGIVKSKLDFILRRCGEEMLVITNPATRAAADQFAIGKRAQGWRTNVFETGAGTGQIGTTAAQIQAFIRGRLTSVLCIHPSYVTIIGDDDLVPTFTATPGEIPSDLQYSLKTDADELPDVAVGRIIGNDQAAVATAVTKILGYETTAPTGNGMLNKALIAAQFQDDDNDGQENRTFIQFAETVRNGLVARGVAVDRVYGEHPGNNPQRFVDGTPLPAALLKPTFGWNGTGADVSAGWNQGRFMVVHRDHGWSDGWGTPGYGTADVQALTNGSLLPVVLSINCSSGAYDYDETSFAGEALVKPDGGAVGVFGDTRDSPSTANTQMSLGFVDALLPSVLPGEGPATKQRTGDALIHGKLRLNGISPLPNGTTRSEFYLWHYYGDPSMQMWGGGNAPIVFNPALFEAVYKAKIPNPGDPPFEVEVKLPKELLGQPISLLQNGQVIGKAFAGDGVATIPASFGDGSVKPGELEVAVEGDGAQPVKIPVTGVPPADLIVSELAASSITVKNQGGGGAGPFKATVTDSQANVLTFSFDGLAAGATATQQFDCEALPLRSRTALADSDGQVAESDEANNTASGVFSCPN
ncbi:MAG: C25 family cysteine peptidase [Conexibacter sp.]